MTKLSVACAAAVTMLSLPQPEQLEGQAHILTVRGDHAIEADGPSSPLTEPFLAVDPVSASHLVVGTIVAPTAADSPWHCATFASFDAGVSWTRHDFAMERCIDPWVLFTGDGAVVFIGIELSHDVEGDGRFHLVAFRSNDGGLTWTDQPVSLGRGYEHAMLFANRVGSSKIVYLTSRRMRRTPNNQPRHTVYLASSADGGRGFRRLAELRPSNAALNPTGLGVLGDGTLALSYFDFQRNVDGLNREGMLSRSRAWLYRSIDGGQTFSEPLLITDECASGVEGSFPGYPSFALDASNGPFRNRLYHACVRPGFEGVALTHSTDLGETWGDPIRADASTSDGTPHVRTAMLAVNDDGVVGIAWYDRRHDPDRMCQDFYFTASVDGGVTVIPPKRISTETSCPDAPGNGRAGRSWPAGGDYSSVAAAGDGLFHLVWADSRGGRFALRHSVVRVERE
jgi:hypothetical protein